MVSRCDRNSQTVFAFRASTCAFVVFWKACNAGIYHWECAPWLLTGSLKWPKILSFAMKRCTTRSPCWIVVSPRLRCEISVVFRLFPFAHTDFFPIVTVQVSKSRLQLVACASILIASKYEEVMTRSVGEFIYVSDNAYTKEELCKVRPAVVSFGFFCCLSACSSLCCDCRWSCLYAEN